MLSMLDCKVIWSFEDFISYIIKLQNENSNIWFRGVNRANHRLTPSSYRNMKIIPLSSEKCYEQDDIYYTKKIVIEDPGYIKAINKFKSEVLKQNEITAFKHEIEWVFYAQHYGFPTCVLDWTTDPLVALYFAVQSITKNINSTDDEKNSRLGELSNNAAAIYILNPSILNKLSSENKQSKYKPYSIENSKDAQFLSAIITKNWDSRNYTPIAILGSRHDRRMVRQSGNFTLHSSKFLEPLDYIDIIRNGALAKILIPHNVATIFQEILFALDITENSILPFDKKETMAIKLKGLVHSMFDVNTVALGGKNF